MFFNDDIRHRWKPNIGELQILPKACQHAAEVVAQTIKDTLPGLEEYIDFTPAADTPDIKYKQEIHSKISQQGIPCHVNITPVPRMHIALSHFNSCEPHQAFGDRRHRLHQLLPS